MHRIRRVIERKHVVHAQPDASVLEVAVAMSEGRVGAIPILDGEELVGIFSERDLMTRVVVPGRDPGATRVGEVMTRDVVRAVPDESVEDCLDKMRRAGCRHLPVVVDGRVIAVLSMRDLLHDEIEEQESELRNLRAYLHHMPS